jgi:hypothetical protein
MAVAVRSDARNEPVATANAGEPAITVVLSHREARALAHAAELLRAACSQAGIPGSNEALDLSHLRLLSAIERQERHAT